MQPPLEPWPPLHTEQNRSRHGRVRWYFRKVGIGRVRLPDPFEEPDAFRKVYGQCIAQMHRLTPYIPRTNAASKSEGRVAKRQNPVYSTVWRARHRAKAKGRSFSLTTGWMIGQIARQEGRCAVTGIVMELSADNDDSPFLISIDRIDNRRGYTPDNCRLVALAVNLAINRWGLEVYLDMAREAVKRTDRHTFGVAFGSEPPHLEDAETISAT